MPTESDLREAIIARANLAPQMSRHLQMSPDLVEPGPSHRLRSRPVLMSATVVAVLAIAAAPALLERGGGHGSGAGAHGSGAGAPPTAASPTTATASPGATSTSAPVFEIPQTPAQLASRFRAVLGDTATFTVTDTGAPVGMGLPSLTSAAPTPTGPSSAPPTPTSLPTPVSPTQAPPATNGAAIVGTLTASGISGGFDLQIFSAGSGDEASCDDPDRSKCTVRDLADGSSLAVGREPLQDSPDGVTYEVDLIRIDGAELVMHLSNERDPKGDSTVLSAHPPLTTEQMTALVTSDRW